MFSKVQEHVSTRVHSELTVGCKARAVEEMHVNTDKQFNLRYIHVYRDVIKIQAVAGKVLLAYI